MSRLSSLKGAALAALLAVQILGQASPAGAQESVTLTFGWPSDLKAHVTFQSKRTKINNGQSEEIGVAGSYDLMSSAVAEGLLISFENIKTEIKAPDSGAQAMVNGLLAGALSRPPSYLVAPDGRFIRADRLDQFRDQLLSGLETALSEVPDRTRGKVLEMTGKVVSKEQIELGISTEWNAMVGFWLDAELEQDETYELSYDQATPAFGGLEVPMRTSFQYKGRKPCNDQDQAERCVELALRSFVDPAGLADVLEPFLAQLPSDQTPPRIDELRQESSLRLISEPDSLVPHLMESTKTTATTMTSGGQTKAASRVEIKRYVFSY